MTAHGKIDFSTRPYEEWVKFIFDRGNFCGKPARLRRGKQPIHPQEPAVLVRHLTRLCQDLPNLVHQYDWAQIDMGLWAAFVSFRIERSFGRDIVPITAQIQCIQSMRIVFSDVVSKIPSETVMENIFFMWWHIVCSFLPKPGEGAPEDNTLKQQYYDLLLPILFSMDSTSDRERSIQIKGLKETTGPGIKYIFWQWSESAVGTFRNVQLPIYDAIFEVLKELLGIENRRCQSCILHGLGHLIHPGRRALVQNFIERHRDEASEKGLKWLEECRDGTVM